MIAISYKAKHYGWIALKGIILVVTTYYVYNKLSQADREIDWLWQWTQRASSYAWFGVFVALATINWLLETQKWRTAASQVRSISFRTAWKQSLMALTASLATPNRIGEYGAKALFFPPRHRKKIMLFTFAGQSSQMAITVLMGSAGLLVSSMSVSTIISPTFFWGSLGITLVILGLMYRYRKMDWFVQGASPLRIWSFYRNLSTTLWGTLLGYSLLRYFCFSSLFYVILLVFGGSMTVLEFFPVITILYLLVSIIPSFVLLDVVIRSGVAVWLFSFYNIQEIIILGTIFLMWFLNVVLPALLGSWYLLTVKKQPV